MTHYLIIGRLDRGVNLCDKGLLRKGSTVYVEGNLREAKWTDRSGVERSGYRLRATDTELLSPRNTEEHPSADAYRAVQPPSGVRDDIPF
jgi:single-stranded DNA-binding protein